MRLCSKQGAVQSDRRAPSIVFYHIIALSDVTESPSFCWLLSINVIDLPLRRLSVRDLLGMALTMSGSRNFSFSF